MIECGCYDQCPCSRAAWMLPLAPLPAVLLSSVSWRPPFVILYGGGGGDHVAIKLAIWTMAAVHMCIRAPGGRACRRARRRECETMLAILTRARRRGCRVETTVPHLDSSIPFPNRWLTTPIPTFTSSHRPCSGPLPLRRCCSRLPRRPLLRLPRRNSRSRRSLT